jgi:hypothetical protein
MERGKVEIVGYSRTFHIPSIDIYNWMKFSISADVFLAPLKGQCHEMVVEVRPWSGRLGLN